MEKIDGVAKDTLYGDWVKKYPKSKFTVNQFYRYRSTLRGAPYDTHSKKEGGVVRRKPSSLMKIIGEVPAELSIVGARKLLAILSGETGLMNQKASVVGFEDESGKRTVIITQPMMKSSREKVVPTSVRKIRDFIFSPQSWLFIGHDNYTAPHGWGDPEGTVYPYRLTIKTDPPMVTTLKSVDTNCIYDGIMLLMQGGVIINGTRYTFDGEPDFDNECFITQPNSMYGAISPIELKYTLERIEDLA